MQPNWPQKVTTFVTKVLIVFATTALTIMMFLTASDVACRYFFNSPISGTMEVSEFLMAIIVPFSIAYCALQKSHVAVDLIVDHLPNKARKLLNIIIILITIFFIILMSWQNYLYIFETYSSQLTSAVLLIPAYPFVVPTALGFLVYAIILLVQLFSSQSKEVNHESV